MFWALLTDRILLVHWQDTFPQPVPWGLLFSPGDNLEMDVAKLRQLAPVQQHIAGRSWQILPARS
jgi:hypothetical protein